jgi:hypothetical protein
VPELPWTSPEWLAEATAWIRERAEVAGDIEQPHVRPWSTVLRVPTTEGDLYFKAVSAIHRYEAALTGLLAELQPGRVAEVVAVDAELGWLLMRDGGTRLRELVETHADLHHWERLLPGYAQLQIEMAPQAESLVELGVPDERLAVLPDHFRELLATRPKGLTAAEHERLLDAVPRVDDMCRELAAYGIAETIQHDDLHDGQVFVHDRGYHVFDWGDSSVSHPFHSLTVVLRMTAWQHDLEPGGRELQRLRDAYIEPFGRGLQPAAELAYRTGTIARSLAWHRWNAAQEPELTEDEDAVDAPYGLKLFLADGPIGTWRAD